MRLLMALVATALAVACFLLFNACSLEDFFVDDYEIAILNAEGTLSRVAFGDSESSLARFDYRYTLANQGIAEATSLEIVLEFFFDLPQGVQSQEILHVHTQNLPTNGAITIEESLSQDELGNNDLDLAYLSDATISEIRFFNTNQSDEALTTNFYDDDGKIQIHNAFSSPE